jgi:hypothetical protein
VLQVKYVSFALATLEAHRYRSFGRSMPHDNGLDQLIMSLAQCGVILSIQIGTFLTLSPLIHGNNFSTRLINHLKTAKGPPGPEIQAK